LNGALAGLVAITAGCANVSPIGSLIIGAGAGILVVISVTVLDSVFKIDDPVGAVSVHGVCGAFGTLMVGLLDVSSGLFYGGGLELLGIQAIGVATGFVWAFGIGLILFVIIKRTVGLRVTEEEELRGLDIGEHGMEGYSGFQIFTTQ
jgi:ammonium transporter, Amt family